MKRMNELFYLTKMRRIINDMATKQIILYANQLLKPSESGAKHTDEKHS